MAIKIITHDASRTIFHKGSISLDITRKTAILIRQSGRKANINHYESRLLQESLLPFVREARMENNDDNILLYDEGAGVSGTKGIDKRQKLKALHIAIADGLIGDIVVARADRLFRNKHFDNVSTFTILAEKMRIKVIVPTTNGVIVYDFTKTEDLQRFQQDMLIAYKQIEHQIGYMNRARVAKMARGLYGGGYLPLPYVLLKDMPKEEQVPVIYQPWLDDALTLFQKFHEFDFNIGRMARYVESRPYLFPFMGEEDQLLYQPVTHMPKTPGGYTFVTVEAIAAYLSNLTLGGYAYGGKDTNGDTLLVQNTIEAAIPLELLEPAYAAIKGEYLDGTPFETAKVKARRQWKYPGDGGPDAILHGLLTSEDGTIGVDSEAYSSAGPTYTCYFGGYRNRKFHTNLVQKLTKWVLPCREIDRILLNRLIALAEYDSELVKRIQKYFQAVKKEKSDIEVLDLAIQQKQTRLKKVSKLLVLLTQQDENSEEVKVEPNDPLVKEHRELAAGLRRLQEQRKTVEKQEREDPAKSIKNFYGVLEHLRTEFLKQSPQTKKDIIKRLIDEAEIHQLSPHLYLLRIVWIKPIAGERDDVALLWRATATKARWSTEEDAVLRMLYPEADVLTLMQALPDKAMNRMRLRASTLGIKRQQHALKNPFFQTVTWRDLEVAKPEEREVLWKEMNNMAKSTKKRGRVAVSWLLPVDEISLLRSFVIQGNEAGLPSRCQCPR